jgi:hypothetical protein
MKIVFGGNRFYFAENVFQQFSFYIEQKSLRAGNIYISSKYEALKAQKYESKTQEICSICLHYLKVIGSWRF